MIMSVQEYLELLESDDPESRDRVRHDSAADNVWYEIIQDYPKLRRIIPWNRTVPPMILELLAKDADCSVRREVASRRRITAELSEQLSSDPDASVRNCIANNQKTPLRLILKMTRDPV